MPQSSMPRRVPLLWLLIPFAVGIAVARAFPFLPFWLLAGAALSCLAFAFWSTKRPTTVSWGIALPATAFLIGMLRFSAANEHQATAITSVPREANLVLKLEKLYGTAYSDAASGIAIIREAPPTQLELQGSKVFFFLDTGDLNHYPKSGESFRCGGVLRPLPALSESDRFDAYLRNQGVSQVFKQGYMLARTKTAIGPKAFFHGILESFSETLSLNKQSDGPLTGAYKGLMLGLKSELSPEQKQLFLSNGTMHLFAISGLHIGVIAICFHHLLGIIGLKSGYRAIVALNAVALFVLVTGGSASSWRALLMIACFYLSSFSKRQSSPLNALALSAFIFLLIAPGQLFQAGFQMSYLSVAAILMYGLPLARTLNELTPLYANIPKGIQSRPQRMIIATKIWILNSLGVSLAAFLVSSILGIYYFQIFPSYGLLINLFALPAASLAIVSGFISILLSPVNALISASELFNNAALVLIYSIHELLEFTNKLPLASIATAEASARSVGIALLALFLSISFSYVQSKPPKIYLWQGATALLALATIIKLQ